MLPTCLSDTHNLRPDLSWQPHHHVLLPEKPTKCYTKSDFSLPACVPSGQAPDLQHFGNTTQKQPDATVPYSPRPPSSISPHQSLRRAYRLPYPDKNRTPASPSPRVGHLSLSLNRQYRFSSISHIHHQKCCKPYPD